MPLSPRSAAIAGAVGSVIETLRFAHHSLWKQWCTCSRRPSPRVRRIPARGGRPAPRGLAALTSELGLLYGCDYNPEQWPREVWREDVALMRAAGVNLVTVGVFSWALLEPRPGVLVLDWLGEVLDLLHAGGIAVDLATPTASPPAWLGVRWPETLAVTADGVRLSYGSRNHFCPSSPVYRAHALAIAGALVDRFASHPAVRMWHIGNEYGQVCHCDLCAVGFRTWLQQRHGTLDELNRAWGTTFWSQRYDDWAEVVPPRAAPYLINPTQDLDFRRFASDQLLALYLEQRELVRRAAPSTPVTTNFMGFHALTDYWRWAPEVDVLDWASAGIGAAALARRWNSPLLVDVNEHTLAAVLAQPALTEALENIEGFRALVDNAQQVITNTKDLKRAKREQGGKLTPEQTTTQSETAKRRTEIREKLQKLVAKIPVFMYTTDYREEALKHVIQSLDPDLFERVTGLTVTDFKTLTSLGLFNAQHINHAIYQFKRFESASLDYALTDDERQRRHQHEQIGLWDTVAEAEGA